MGFLLALLIIAAVVGGYVWYQKWSHERYVADRKENLDRFFSQLHSSTGQEQPTAPPQRVGDGPTPTIAIGDVAWADLRPGAGSLSYSVETSVSSPTDVEHALAPAGGRAGIRVQTPDELPTFADVGGMEALKEELRGSVGLILQHKDRADDYGIAWNGVLLHGPSGTGKSHLARALAGELGCSLLHLSTGDLVSGVVGESAQNVIRAFQLADAHRPCVLFFDEFDSVAAQRDAATHAEERRTVNQLLTCLEQYREHRDLIVVAATNDLDHLDDAVVRPGRFDRHVRVDLPDREARRAILAVHLASRPSDGDVDLDAVADRTRGMTAAAIAQLVDAAALAAFRDAAAQGETVHITAEHLETALQERGGQDRPTVEDWTWDRLVLPRGIKAELHQLESLMAEPEVAERLGIEPPRGVLLTGPPGTGKTTIARVLAAQSRCSFYPVSAADVTSRWMGEAEDAIRRLFDRARSNRPSIVFIDEIDALAPARGGQGTDGTHRIVTQLLAEIDGMTDSAGVLVIGATNRPEDLDPALVRGGRLSRRIEIGLPDEDARWAILEVLTARMPTVGIDLHAVARHTEGWTGADLRALCQQAAVDALVRTRADGEPDASVEVLPRDIATAMDKLRP